MNETNVQICSNCGEINLLYAKNCNKCKHYLRATIVNIDLWKTIWQLFESPRKALTNVIYAEYKNFLGIVLVLLSLKLFLTSVFLQSAFKLTLPDTQYFLLNICLLVFIYLSSILMISGISTQILNRYSRTRLKDNLSIFCYAFIPYVLSFFILAPVEYSIFGKHWFIFNPSPFLIKETLSYLLVSIEALMLLWSLFILARGFYLQSNSKLLTGLIVGGIVITVLLELIFMPFILL